MIVRKGKSSWWQIVRIGKSSWWQDTQQRSHLLLQQLLSCKRGLRTQSNPSQNWTALSYNLTKDVSSLPGGPSIPRPGIPHTFLSHVHVDAFHGLFTCVVKRFPMPWQINLISWFQWCRRCSLRCTCIRGSFKVQHHPCLSVSASLYVCLSVCASLHAPLCMCGISLTNYTFATPCICTQPPLRPKRGISMIIGIRFCGNTGMSPSWHFHHNEPLSATLQNSRWSRWGIIAADYNLSTFRCINHVRL